MINSEPKGVANAHQRKEGSIMAKGEFDSKKFDKLVTFVKKEGVGNYSETAACNATGIERSQILRYLVKAELAADPKLKVPATATGILKAKKSGLRWPRVAAYAGISESEAKKLFAEAGGSAEDAYSGRGRPTGSVGVKHTSGRRGAKTKSAPAATSGRRGASKRSSKAEAAPATRGSTRGRRGTRASADPK